MKETEERIKTLIKDAFGDVKINFVVIEDRECEIDVEVSEYASFQCLKEGFESTLVLKVNWDNNERFYMQSMKDLDEFLSSLMSAVFKWSGFEEGKKILNGIDKEKVVVFINAVIDVINDSKEE